jgi:hypothetical protein
VLFLFQVNTKSVAGRQIRPGEGQRSGGRRTGASGKARQVREAMAQRRDWNEGISKFGRGKAERCKAGVCVLAAT